MRYAWIIITPRGHWEFDSVRQTRRECWSDYITYNAPRPLDYDALKLYKTCGYRCIKVKLSEVK